MELARIGTKSAFKNSGDYLEISKRNKILRLCFIISIRVK